MRAFWNTKITDEGIKNLHLISLDVSGNPNVTDKGIQHMINSLKKLYVCNNENITSEGIQNFKLDTLWLNQYGIGDEGIINMKLTELNANNSKVTNRGIQNMNLSRIYFDQNSNITKDGIKHMTNLNLKS